MTAPNVPSDETLSVSEALDWVAELFDEPRGTIQATTLRTALPAWDSLGQLILMSALDERFRIQLTPEELVSLTSVQDILDVLARHFRLN